MHKSEERTLNRKAECCCGQLSVEVYGEPYLHSICHCSDCKKRTGSAFGISSYFKKDAVIAQSGKTDQYSFYHKEKNHEQIRHFCSSCGTTLYWYVSSFPDLVGIAGGCFIEDSLGEPTYSISHGGKLPWVRISEDIETNA
ncbi:GFA family protein [Simiduia aestuariiviva]|uniref:CENP-V/GFA domain-containing protein n=1 Tax=Simiduia aestuariiviva TaxID=1510459 RepID=A0A839UMP6_9GAMM|nr:GFA family protein [Simiduia aestuariiviva]MBB3169454.1 hypothetical protein [Simiduia aestuariiviva]